MKGQTKNFTEMLHCEGIGLTINREHWTEEPGRYDASVSKYNKNKTRNRRCCCGSCGTRDDESDAVEGAVNHQTNLRKKVHGNRHPTRGTTAEKHHYPGAKTRKTSDMTEVSDTRHLSARTHWPSGTTDACPTCFKLVFPPTARGWET